MSTHLSTPLAPADLGPVSLLAPEVPVRQVTATYGRLWQWTGDGAELYTLSVAVRATRLGTPTGARHHLRTEVDQLLPDLAPPPASRSVEDVEVEVAGATGSAAADVVGRAFGADVRHRIIVTTDGEHMHVTRVVVPDTARGRLLADEVTGALRVRD